MNCWGENNSLTLRHFEIFERHRGQCAEERSASLASGALMLRKGNAVEIALNGAAIEGVDVGGGAHHQSGLFDAMRSW